MNENEITKTLTETGGKLWEKGEMRRVYFDAKIVLGLEISRYNTGNISSAAIKGERISNAEASRCENLKFWYDLADGKFHWKNAEALHGAARIALDEFVAATRAKLS